MWNCRICNPWNAESWATLSLNRTQMKNRNLLTPRTRKAIHSTKDFTAASFSLHVCAEDALSIVSPTMTTGEFAQTKQSVVREAAPPDCLLAGLPWRCALSRWSGHDNRVISFLIENFQLIDSYSWSSLRFYRTKRIIQNLHCRLTGLILAGSYLLGY